MTQTHERKEVVSKLGGGTEFKAVFSIGEKLWKFLWTTDQKHIGPLEKSFTCSLEKTSKIS